MAEKDHGDVAVKIAFALVAAIALAIFLHVVVPEEARFAALVLLITYYSILRN